MPIKQNHFLVQILFIAIKDGFIDSTVATASYTKPGSGSSGSGSGSSGDHGNSSYENTSDGNSILGIPSIPSVDRNTIPEMKGMIVNPGTGITVKPETGTGREPFIKGAEGKIGWDVIRAEEEKAEDGNVINVDMNGSAVVPVDIVNNVTGESYSIQISLSHEGEFGFTAVLSIDLGEENAGYTASLHYYNEGTKELEFICSKEVAQDGTGSLSFTHASDYVIAIDVDREESGSVTESAQTEETAGNDDNVLPESPKTVQGKKNMLWPVAAGIIVLAAIIFAGVSVWKKKGERQV